MFHQKCNCRSRLFQSLLSIVFNLYAVCKPLRCRFERCVIEVFLLASENRKKFLLERICICKLETNFQESQLPNPDQLSQYHVYVENDEQRFTIIISLLKLKLLRGKTIFFVNSVERNALRVAF